MGGGGGGWGWRQNFYEKIIKISILFFTIIKKGFFCQDGCWPCTYDEVNFTVKCEDCYSYYYVKNYIDLNNFICERCAPAPQNRNAC